MNGSHFEDVKDEKERNWKIVKCGREIHEYIKSVVKNDMLPG